MSKIFLDSGAYTAWTRGRDIDLNNYVQFIRRSEHLLDLYASLDVIPGSNGLRTCDPAKVEGAAQLSYRNHQYMKHAGLTPIPVFHQDEDFKWLERYLSEDENYIALAPHGVHPHNVIPWLDECYGLLRDGASQLRIKVHALGVTSSVLMRRYSFTSVDSDTWAQHAGHGQILIPRYVSGQPNYSLQPRSVSVTERSSMRRNHVDRMTPLKKKQVHRFLNEEVGIDLAKVRAEKPHARWRTNIVYFNGLAAACNTRLFFVTGANLSQRDTLLECDAQSHLVSYEPIQNRPKALENYVRNAKGGVKKEVR